MDVFYRLLLQSVLILPSAFAATGIAAPWMKCTPKVGQKCKTFGGAFFMPKKPFAKKYELRFYFKVRIVCVWWSKLALWRTSVLL